MSMCCDGVHVDCNATVLGNTIVPVGTKVCSGEVFKKDTIDATDFLKKVETNIPFPSIPISGKHITLMML